LTEGSQSYRQKGVLYQLSRNLPENELIIVVGDFNNTLSNLDRNSKTVHSNDQAFLSLDRCVDINDLYDIWRARNPRVLEYSRKQVVENRLVQSRIDYFLVSKSLGTFVKNIYYNDTAFSDHSCVLMSFDMDLVERGTGVWVLNNTFLLDDEYKIKVRQLIEKEFKLFVV